MLTPERLKKIIDGDTTRQKRVSIQDAYVNGDNPSILKPDAKEAPDNRIPVSFAMRAVEMYGGYLGKEGNVIYKGTGYDSKLKTFFDDNNEGLLTARLLETACTYGEAFEVQWVEQGKANVIDLPVAQCIAVYDGKLKPKMTDFIRYWIDEDSNTKAEVYDSKIKQGFIKYNGKNEFVIDGLKEEHGYKRVPITRYVINPYGKNIFDHVTALIDAFDKIISNSFMNELEKLSAAIMLLAGAINKDAEDSADGISDEEKLVTGRLKYIDRLILDGTGSVADKVAFLTKNIDPTFPGTAAGIIERLIYEMLCLFNPNDETFNTPSGEAAKWKIIGFEYKSTKITSYFSLGLQDRIALYKGVDATLTGNAQNTDVTIEWKRNLPQDIKLLADIAVALEGIISQESILKMFPSYVVEDVQEEIKKLKKEKEERMKDAPKLFPDGQPGQNQEEEAENV